MANPTTEEEHHQEEEEEEDEEKEKEGSNNNFTCGICIETKSSNMRFSISDKCGHSFCTDCLKIYIHVKVVSDLAVDIKCPGSNCKEFLDPLSCRPLLLHRHQTFNKWCDNLFESALLRFEDRCYCPYKDCSALVVNECGGTPKRSECPNCKRLFCFQCKIPYHWSYHCADVGKIGGNDDNDILFEQLVKREKWIRCPKCRYYVERTSGCSRITCRCHTNFCYNCGKTSKCKHDEMDPLIGLAIFLCLLFCVSFPVCLLHFTIGI